MFSLLLYFFLLPFISPSIIEACGNCAGWLFGLIMFKCRIMLALEHLLAHSILFSCIGSKLTEGAQRSFLLGQREVSK